MVSLFVKKRMVSFFISSELRYRIFEKRFDRQHCRPVAMLTVSFIYDCSYLTKTTGQGNPTEIDKSPLDNGMI